MKRRFRAGRPKIVLLRLPYINTAACHLARTAVGTFRYKSLALALRGRERARLRRARRDDRDGGIGCLVRATEGDRATAQGLLGLREFSPSARACRPNMIARPCRPEHLLFYWDLGLALALRGRERARLRRARRDDRDGGIGCLVRATEGDRATAQGLLGLREFSPSARACRPNMIARPCRPEHLLFY